MVRSLIGVTKLFSESPLGTLLQSRVAIASCSSTALLQFLYRLPNRRVSHVMSCWRNCTSQIVGFKYKLLNARDLWTCGYKNVSGFIFYKHPAISYDLGFWMYRPLSDSMVRAAADDVRFLLYIYHKMMEKLNQRSLWLLAVRGSLYCQCFCISDNEYADWPSLPPIPEANQEISRMRISIEMLRCKWGTIRMDYIMLPP